MPCKRVYRHHRNAHLASPAVRYLVYPVRVSVETPLLAFNFKLCHSGDLTYRRDNASVLGSKEYGLFSIKRNTIPKKVRPAPFLELGSDHLPRDPREGSTVYNSASKDQKRIERQRFGQHDVLDTNRAACQVDPSAGVSVRGRLPR